MDKKRFLSTLSQVQWGRDLWRVIALGMAASNVLLACAVVGIDSSEKTIVIPPVVEKAFWVHGDQVSSEYLEQMALFFASLVLTYHPDNIDGQIQLFLRHADPAAHGPLSARLALDRDRIRRNALAQVFYPVAVRVREADRQVALSGDVVSMVGGQATGTRRATYRMKFSYRDARLFVSEFGEAPDETDPFAPVPAAPAP